MQGKGLSTDWNCGRRKNVDELLLRRAQRGDPDAFEQLMTPQEQLIWRVCWHYTGDREAASDCVGEIPGKTLKQLEWGHRFNVNVIRVLRGKKHLNMPSGNVELKAGDRLLVIGRREDLRTLRLSLNLPEQAEATTLRAFTENQEGDAAHLYATVIPVD